LTILNSLFVCTLIAFGKSQTYASIISRGAAALCIAVVALTPILGAQGATIGVLVGEGLTLWMLVRGATKLVLLPPARSILKPGIAGIGMAAGAIAFTSVPPLFQLGLSCLIFILVLFLSGGVSREDIRALREHLI